MIAYDAGTLWCAVQPGAGPARLADRRRHDHGQARRRAGAAASGGPALPARGRGRRRLARGGRAAVAVDPTSGQAALVAAPRSARRRRSSTRPAPSGRRSRRRAAAASLRLDPASGTATAQAPLGPSPSALTVAGGSAWVTDSVDQSIERFAVARKALRPAATITLPALERARARPRSRSSAGSCGCTSAAGCCASASRPTRCSARPASPPSPAARSRPGAAGSGSLTRSRAHDRGAVRLLDATDGLPAGRRIVVGGRPTALATDGRSAWVLDSAASRLIRVFPD